MRARVKKEIRPGMHSTLLDGYRESITDSMAMLGGSIIDIEPYKEKPGLFRGVKVGYSWHPEWLEILDDEDNPSKGVERFEVGKYYRWIGTDEEWRENGAASEMLPMKDGKSRRCIKTSGLCGANFEGVERTFGDMTWSWQLDNFEEVVMEKQEPSTTVVAPVTEFKTGHWYRWTGPKERPGWFNDEGKMDAILDGAPRKCINGNGICATFKGVERTFSDTWNWKSGMRHFEEVLNPGIYAQAVGRVARAQKENLFVAKKKVILFHIKDDFVPRLIIRKGFINLPTEDK